MRQQTPSKTKSTPTPSFTPVQTGLLQRKCSCGGTAGLAEECTSCRSKRVTGNHHLNSRTEPTDAPPLVHEVLHSPGQPLEEETHQFMAARFGHDFSQVRVHTDARAAESARMVNALAYTVGQHLVFGTGRYPPQTRAEKKLLAHELTHILQQRETGDRGSVPEKLTVSHPDDVHEREANRIAAWALADNPVSAERAEAGISTGLTTTARLPRLTGRRGNTLPALQRQIAGGQGVLPALMPTVLAAPMVGGVITPDQFKFKNVVPHSGSGTGGWKAACVIARFAKFSMHTPTVFTCDIEVGVPEVNFKGPVSDRFAQVEASNAANTAAQIVLRKHFRQLPEAAATVCIEFRKEMQKILRRTIPGALVTKCTTKGLVPVVIGKEKKEKGDEGAKDDRCFIATAAYGSPLAPELDILRRFRDQRLLSSRHGKVFVRTYYKHSPPIARFIAKHPALRATVRGLLKPVIAWARQP